MTLWLPLIDATRSYQSVFASLGKAVPAKHTCINSLNVKQPQRLLLDYYTDIKLRPIESSHQPSCDLYLIQDIKGTSKIQPTQEWKMIWHGKRPSDRKEGFRLFQKQN